MKIKQKTGYKIVFGTFVAFTAISYIWTIASFVRWIYNLIF